MTAPAACAACNDHESCISTAIDTPAAAIQAPGFRKPMISLDDTFSKAQTDRRTTQLLAPGETPSPSQLDQPSRRGCSAVPSRWASTVVPGASGAKKRPRRSRRSPFTKNCSLHTGPLPPLGAVAGAHVTRAAGHCESSWVWVVVLVAWLTEWPLSLTISAPAGHPLPPLPFRFSLFF